MGQQIGIQNSKTGEILAKNNTRIPNKPNLTILAIESLCFETKIIKNIKENKKDKSKTELCVNACLWRVLVKFATLIYVKQNKFEVKCWRLL